MKCAACAHIWTARNEEEPVLEAIDPIPDKAAPEPEPATPKAPHRAFRERAEQKKQDQLKTAAAGAWGGLAVAVAGVFAASILFRADIVSVWPRASSAYAAVGIDANAYGVAIDNLSVERGEEHGIPTIVLSGEIRNIDRQARQAPQLQARLIGEDGASVLEWTIVLDGDAMAPGERRHFTTVAADPPESAIEAEVTLAGLMLPDDVEASQMPDVPAPETQHAAEAAH